MSHDPRHQSPPAANRIIHTTRLGTATIPSPLREQPECQQGGFVAEDVYIRLLGEVRTDRPGEGEILFEKAGPRERLFFDPSTSKAAIVTCGGLCPGLNNVVRALYLELAMNYGLPEVLGIRFGFQGLNPAEGQPPVKLTLDLVEDIHKLGGTVLGSSRGPQDAGVMADFLVQQRNSRLTCCFASAATAPSAVRTPCTRRLSAENCRSPS
jgi:6-phosphofructokinase 1